MVATMVTNDKNNHLMFNEDLKNKFINGMVERGTLAEESSKNYRRIFYVTCPQEKALGKDLNEFTLGEMESILYSFKANNRNTIETYGRIISSYLNWSVQNGFIKENVLADFKPDSFEKYLTNEEAYLTEKQLSRYEDYCDNYQDSIILRLLFVGAGGKRMSEIRNLKKTDIDWENKRIKLINSLSEDENSNPIKYTQRYIDVDDKTLTLLRGAIAQKIYVKQKSENFSIENPNIRAYTDLVENDYVIRASITKTDTSWSNPTEKQIVYRRIQNISKSLNVHLSSKLIQRSGMIYHANQLIQDEELTLDDFKVVADRYNLKSYHNLKGFLTIENIRRTYPTK
ncbi:hypothetical protein P9294_gp051 [Bacillus phage FADO]|uniref:Integrase n=1 Tax=Bacillus phage FADO TaxID=2917160 RepID=A0AAE9GA74_9CAUD|nr:hypothetical protein P9294_gp051 [Bacillus phage FADO]UNY48766.1 hypothetical protein fado_51 [Bacillus phage FADO]UUG68137.1 hypothetical protein [Bacillus phage PK-3]